MSRSKRIFTIINKRIDFRGINKLALYDLTEILTFLYI